MSDGVPALSTTILQPQAGRIDASTYLASDPGSVLWGRLPCEHDEALVTVDSGTTVTIDTLSHEGLLEDQGRDPARFFGRYGVTEVLEDAIALAASAVPHDARLDGPHIVSRPIAVRGAEPGDVLAIRVGSLLPRVPYGVISNRHGRGALPDEFPLAGQRAVSVFTPVRSGYGEIGPARFELAPFLGLMGVAVKGSERPHSVPPGRHGGNLDIRLLTEGSTLYLPVQVAEALAYVGDPHFAQGDGEVALTALEASLRATLTFAVIPRETALKQFGELMGPLAETQEYLIPTGLDEDLDTAVQDAVRAAIALLGARFNMPPDLAYAYLSAATDFRISQVVDVVKGVHATIRKGDFA
jgi:acetamidase/formamidase